MICTIMEKVFGVISKKINKERFNMLKENFEVSDYSTENHEVLIIDLSGEQFVRIEKDLESGRHYVYVWNGVAEDYVSKTEIHFLKEEFNEQCMSCDGKFNRNQKIYDYPEDMIGYRYMSCKECGGSSEVALDLF